jgi:hypothetical protein
MLLDCYYNEEKAFCVNEINDKIIITEKDNLYNLHNLDIKKDYCYMGHINGFFNKSLLEVYVKIKIS